MKIGNILVAKGLATAADINRAAEHQLANGGRLGDSIVALGILTHEQIEKVLNEAPQAPISAADTGVDPCFTPRTCHQGHVFGKSRNLLADC
jgi:hypothetical protein